MTRDNQWHLNKSVSLGQIVAIFVQTVALIWFVASLRNDVDVAQKEIIRNETRIETLEGIVQNQAVLLARIDENLKAIRDVIDENTRKD